MRGEDRSLVGCPNLSEKHPKVYMWAWLKIKRLDGQTAGFGPCFHLPGQPILEFRFFETQPYQFVSVATIFLESTSDRRPDCSRQLGNRDFSEKANTFTPHMKPARGSLEKDALTGTPKHQVPCEKRGRVLDEC